MDPIHQDIGVPLLAVPDLLQEGLDVVTVDIVSTTLSLRLQNIFLRVGDGTFKVFVSNFVLRYDEFLGETELSVVLSVSRGPESRVQ